MNEAEFVHCLDGEHNLGHVKASDVLREDFVFDQHRHQIATREELHEHIEKARILEGRKQLHHPRALGLGQNVTLSPHMGQLILLEHLGLLERLEGVDPAIGALADQLDFAKSALADDLDRLEVFGGFIAAQKP